MRILITDDHQLFADGLRSALEDLQDGLSCVVALSAEVALDILGNDTAFDLFVVDLNLPGIDGVSLLKSLSRRCPEIPVVVISATESIDQIKSALDQGARGFIPKAYDRVEIQRGLSVVLEGGLFLPDDIVDKIQRIEQSQSSFPTLPGNITSHGITKRQFEVLEYVAKGFSNKQIANTLFLTEHTIKVHLKALFKALGVSNRTQLSQVAKEKGIIA
ncbi:MAG: response regulator transcription factor [Gammaproteobacteria bacterium]|jgi:DNA-binding NarL/FixJ family response regulator|nr:response regulator transcription factor [Gammaproteobacteria bacterium]